ncbi:MAG: EamA family transporter [Candidatus Latescibacteria bacterium]|nr:EamA family transporter [Candidatus Latescibacterota bacterium]NIM22010.1 EamA family transporter [Candidatus Latescibacterota bacterium]NIM66028.1 EamA family transporter [Candidatus Latescibacterota bacterium]NIO02436.1 EamA family transporter [Candidatus Latescibacterota bacterium]NIO29347.1 EamA family transporter [Candidatus Latescibacterota bacterium]
MESYLGEFAALATAFFWTVTALAFEAAGKRVGSLSVNVIRLCIGFVFLSVCLYAFRGSAFPVDASAHAWLWLSISGLVGLVLGDFLLFKAFIRIGSRISMLIMASVPPLTALIGWLIMGEILTPTNYFGMALTIGGIALVVLERNPARRQQVKFSRPVSGVLVAFGGALGQAVGLVLSKYGMGDYDAFSATQIRLIAGIVGFCLITFLARAWGRVTTALIDRKAVMNISLGAFFGPFLGVSFSLLAIQYTTAGVAATIMAIVPVLIIPPSVLLFKEKVTMKEVLGAFIAVAGVAVLFLWK